MITFKQEADYYLIEDDDLICGWLMRNSVGWAFSSLEDIAFTATELRIVADELDKLNG